MIKYGGDTMKDIVKAFDGLPWIIKLILAFPFIGAIPWGIYRVAKGIDTNNVVMILAGILWIFVGWTIFWLIDLITIILYKKVTVFA
jgi:hypothetical protein